jgi:dTDP-glucose 4,6-dehydratase
MAKSSQNLDMEAWKFTNSKPFMASSGQALDMEAWKLDREDLDYVLSRTRLLWEDLRGQQVFITGGTGFFGRWLLETFAWANAELGLDARAVVLTRDVSAFARKAPHLLTRPEIQFHCGDVRTFEFPDGSYSHIIHAATQASARLIEEQPLLMVDTIVDGTRRVLDFARKIHPRRVLLTSSGAVYGRQTRGASLIQENSPAGIDLRSSSSSYAEAKRMAELLMACYRSEHGIGYSVARCFAFVGPYLPLDRHFAIGQFIGDALAGRPIRIHGNGTPRRSYLYGADLAVMLWSLLLDPRAAGTYNVGSEEHRSIFEMAHMVAQTAGGASAVEVENRSGLSDGSTDWYVPNMQLARDQLGLVPGVDLSQAIQRTLSFYSRHGNEA